VEAAVCDKCHALRTAYERIALAEQIIGSLEERISGLERLAELGAPDAVQMIDARGKLAIAQSNSNQRRLEARLAEVDLAAEIGCLARRC